MTDGTNFQFSRKTHVVVAVVVILVIIAIQSSIHPSIHPFIHSFNHPHSFIYIAILTQAVFTQVTVQDHRTPVATQVK